MRLSLDAGGFLIPVFFIASGMNPNVAAVCGRAAGLALTGGLFAALFLVRILDRNRPIAQIVPISHAREGQPVGTEALAEMERKGQIRRMWAMDPACRDVHPRSGGSTQSRPTRSLEMGEGHVLLEQLVIAVALVLMTTIVHSAATFVVIKRVEAHRRRHQRLASHHRGPVSYARKAGLVTTVVTWPCSWYRSSRSVSGRPSNFRSVCSTT